jgi:hypothetical protein
VNGDRARLAYARRAGHPPACQRAQGAAGKQHRRGVYQHIRRRQGRRAQDAPGGRGRASACRVPLSSAASVSAWHGAGQAVNLGCADTWSCRLRTTGAASRRTTWASPSSASRPASSVSTTTSRASAPLASGQAVALDAAARRERNERSAAAQTPEEQGH